MTASNQDAQDTANQETRSAAEMKNIIMPEGELDYILKAAKEKHEAESQKIKEEQRSLVNRTLDQPEENQENQSGGQNENNQQVRKYWYVGYLVFFTPIAIFISLLVFFLLLSNEIGVAVSIIAASAYVAIYLAFGLIKIPQDEVWVISRFGSFYREARNGLRLLCLVPIIDEIDAKVSISEQSSSLYDNSFTGDELGGNDLDFLDASAPIRSTYRYRIKDPAKYTYAAGNALGEIENIFEGILRPILQQLNIDSAQTHKSRICQRVLEWVEGEILELYGVNVSRIQILDIDLPEEIKKFRSTRLEAQTNAQAQVQTAVGLGNALATIREQVKKETGIEITSDEARRIYFDYEGLRTIRETGSNVTLVGQDVKNILKTLEIGQN